MKHLVLAVCERGRDGKLSTTPTLYGFGCSIDAFMYMLKQCTFSAAHFGADYPAYIEDSEGRLLVRMATYKGV